MLAQPSRSGDDVIPPRHKPHLALQSVEQEGDLQLTFVIAIAVSHEQLTR
jgi:hypothetical protein